MNTRLNFIVYGWLVVLTLAEVAMVYVGIPKIAGVILVGGTTLAKVSMIGLQFMHFKYERAVAWLLPAIPVILAVFFTGMLFPDIVYQAVLIYQ